MDQEMESITTNNTWSLAKLPPGHHAIPVKWVYKLKTGPSDAPPKYKARLVARGDQQLHGIDYHDTFSPVVKWSTMRILVSLAAQKCWVIYHLDVKSAFLKGDITEVVFCKQPPGYACPGQEHLVYRLYKALYGLHQSQRAWHAKIDDELQTLGLTPCTSDPGLYVSSTGDLLILLIIYVDDLMITGNDAAKITWLQQRLCDKFAMSLLGPLSLYLGVDFFYSSAGILLSHRRYFLRCLDDMGLTACHPSPIPMDPSSFTTLAFNMDSPLLAGPQITYYRMGVGKLLHSTNTRPEISSAVGVVTRFTSAPRIAHLKALLQIFCYIKGTLDLAIYYQRGGEVMPTGYSDSAYLDDKDERRSTSGYLISLGGGAPTSWRSKLQDEVAQSSTEGEYRALGEAAREAM
jgi:hypothetical protein